MTKSFLTQEVVEQLDYICLWQPELTKFEKNLINDRVAALKKYGIHCVITEKQVKVIADVHRKAGVQIALRGLISGLEALK